MRCLDLRATQSPDHARTRSPGAPVHHIAAGSLPRQEMPQRADLQPWRSPRKLWDKINWTLARPAVAPYILPMTLDEIIGALKTSDAVPKAALAALLTI